MQKKKEADIDKLQESFNKRNAVKRKRAVKTPLRISIIKRRKDKPDVGWINSGRGFR
jgi:hypothetical protein